MVHAKIVHNMPGNKVMESSAKLTYAMKDNGY